MASTPKHSRPELLKTADEIASSALPSPIVYQFQMRPLQNCAFAA